MANYTKSDPEVVEVQEYIMSMLGAPVVSVELVDQQYVHAFNNAISEYSGFINQWAIKSHIANALGLPSSQDFTLRWVSQNFEFAKSFSKAYSEQANVGGTVPVRKDYIVLLDDQQEYFLPDDREVIEVMWTEPAAMNRFLMDPNTNPTWVNHEFGWGYQIGGNFHAMQYIAPVSFTIQLANAHEVRYRTLRGDFSYTVTPRPADESRYDPDYPDQTYPGRTENCISIFPVPTQRNNTRKVWYFYKLKSDLNAYANQDANDLVSSPGTMKIDEIPYGEFNSVSKQWIKQYTYASCKEVLGRIRSKFNELPIPGASVVMDGDTLIAEAQMKHDELRERLLMELEEMNVGKLIELDRAAAENIHASLSFNPMGIQVG